jgi:hypothetical protein
LLRILAGLVGSWRLDYLTLGTSVLFYFFWGVLLVGLGDFSGVESSAVLSLGSSVFRFV